MHIHLYMLVLLWHSTEAVAFFSSPSSPLFPCLLSCLVTSHLLRDSLCIALQTEKIMDLINWSLNAIDTIFSTRSLGSGEPDCPDGTFAAGYTMDAWERWRIVCLAALSVEDIEDIYLFGTMITGLLLIGLGFALGYRRIQKMGTAVQSLTRLPVMIEAVGRAVSIETETINRNMDSIMEKLTALQRKIDGIGVDKESSRGIGMRLLAPRLNNRNLIFSAPPNQHWPRPRPLLVNQPWEEHCSVMLLRSSPILKTAADYTYTHIHTKPIQIQTHTHIHSPPYPQSLASVALNRQPDKRVCD